MKLLLSCLFLTTVLVATQALTEEQLQKLNKIRKECQEETGVSQEALELLRNGQLSDDAKLKPYILCASKKVHLSSESGEFNDEVLRSKLLRISTDEEIEKIVKKCVVKQDTPEETATFVFLCVRKIKPDFVIVD